LKRNPETVFRILPQARPVKAQIFFSFSGKSGFLSTKIQAGVSNPFYLEGGFTVGESDSNRGGKYFHKRIPTVCDSMFRIGKLHVDEKITYKILQRLET
jgi:hypothetical protein